MRDERAEAASPARTIRPSTSCCRHERRARPGARRSPLAEGLPAFDLEAFREGHLTPVSFGSALRNFGVRDLIDALGDYRPAAARAQRPTSARSRPASRR